MRRESPEVAAIREQEIRRLIEESRYLECACFCHNGSGFPRWIKPTNARCCLHIPRCVYDDPQEKGEQR